MAFWPLKSAYASFRMNRLRQTAENTPHAKKMNALDCRAVGDVDVWPADVACCGLVVRAVGGSTQDHVEPDRTSTS